MRPGTEPASGAADPDAEHIAAVEADRPGVAVAVGGAGLVGDAARAAPSGGRTPDSMSAICQVAGASSTVPPAVFDRARLRCRRAALRALAAIGEPGIELDEVAQRNADAAEPDGQPRRLARRQHGRDAGLAEARRQPRRADRIEQPHGRHVERQLQRLAHADVALIAHVEIARPVAGEIGRAVLDHRFLRDQALFEGQPVDERFQRRAGRAARRGSCRSSRSGWRRNSRPSRPRRGSRRSWRRPAPWRRETRGPSLRGRIPGDRFQPFLDALARASAWCRSSRRRLAQRRVGDMGGKRRQGEAACRRRAQRGAGRPRARRARRPSTMRASTRSRAACAALRMAVGPARLRQLRQGDQQGRLRHGQPASAPCRNRRGEAARTPSRLPP